MTAFQHPEHLYALLLLLPITFIFLRAKAWRNQKLMRAGDPGLLAAQMPGRIRHRSTLKFMICIAALIMLITAWANLRRGIGAKTAMRNGVDMMIALDVSNSMLAQDVSPDRLTRAKAFIENLLSKSAGNRAGLILFAGRAYLQCPLTTDFSALRMLLQEASPGNVQTQGTNIATVIELARISFSQKEKKYKTLIVLSDGEEHEASAPSAASAAQTEDGIVIHTLAVGSAAGGKILMPGEGGYKLDETGQPVVTKTNETALKQIAAAGKGSFRVLNNIESTSDDIAASIQGMEQKSLGSDAFQEYENYFPYFITAALVLLVAAWMLPGAKNTVKTQAA